eukprot:m.28182 g.28182  ORF g.28182 m.28182 type:complete len:313 (-) comp11811_c0_seq2:35-973(-)
MAELLRHVCVDDATLLDNDDVAYLIHTNTDDQQHAVHRTYNDFFKLHCGLLDAFPVEGGLGTTPRVIPPLPGKRLLSFRPSKASRRKAAMQLAVRRKPALHDYLSGLLRINGIKQHASLIQFLTDQSSSHLPTPAISKRASSVSLPTSQHDPSAGSSTKQAYVQYQGQLSRKQQLVCLRLEISSGQLHVYRGTFDSRQKLPLLGSFHLSGCQLTQTEASIKITGQSDSLHNIDFTTQPEADRWLAALNLASQQHPAASAPQQSIEPGLDKLQGLQFASLDTTSVVSGLSSFEARHDGADRLSNYSEDGVVLT